MKLFYFYPDSYYPTSAVVLAPDEEIAKQLIRAEVLKEYAYLEDGNGVFPSVDEMLERYVKTAPAGTVITMAQS